MRQMCHENRLIVTEEEEFEEVESRIRDNRDRKRGEWGSRVTKTG
jgi:hypothetical protein